MADRHIYGLVVALIGLALLFGGLTAAYQNSDTQYTVENETHTVDYSSQSSVTPEHDVFAYNDSVTITANGTTLDPGVDYDWNASVGNITWYNSSSTSDGDTAYVDYQYDGATKGAEQSNRVLGSFEPILGLLILPLAVWTALEYSGGGW